ncbi:MAG: hypothetical protein KatS3mg067_0242 [Thermosynechococcus sp.]|nr:hypothetical protein [Thermosynechococcus sp.]BCX11304.1 MAG: hypothetical protein KatS3mg067_0242 [Thermosynechococcus sp.]
MTADFSLPIAGGDRLVLPPLVHWRIFIETLRHEGWYDPSAIPIK